MTDTMSSAADTVRSYFASFALRDPEAIASHVSDDFVNAHTAALAVGCVGRDEYLRRLPEFLADMVDLRYTIDHLVADGGEVAVFYTMSARYQGQSPFELEGAQRLLVADGKITERTDYWCSRRFLDQVESDEGAA